MTSNKTASFQSYLLVGRSEQVTDFIASLGFPIINSNSPDLLTIKPVKDVIKIDQIRELKKSIFQKPLSLSHKIIVLENAEKMPTEAQNALLKTLEEPPTHAIIILQTTNKHFLLPTIISRTTIVTLQKDEAPSGNIYIDHTREENILNIPTIEDPSAFIDNQMVLLGERLDQKIINGQYKEAKKLTVALENLKETKKMISANLNKNFVLTKLFIN